MPILTSLRYFRYSRLVALCVVILLAGGCAVGPAIVGDWKAMQGAGSVTFAADGTFEAVDNQGMVVTGTYRLVGAERIQFEVLHGGHETEVIGARVVHEHDRLTLIFPGEKAVETYFRLP